MPTVIEPLPGLVPKGGSVNRMTHLPVIDVPPGVTVHASAVELPVLPAPVVGLCVPDDRLSRARPLVVYPGNRRITFPQNPNGKIVAKTRGKNDSSTTELE